jgi:hypothetical protein
MKFFNKEEKIVAFKFLLKVSFFVVGIIFENFYNHNKGLVASNTNEKFAML